MKKNIVAKQNFRWFVVTLCIGLLIAACGAEPPVNENESTEELPTNEDVDAPLEDVDILLDGAPDNDELPELAKADETFPAQFDLVDTQSPVGNQGARGLCTMFATVSMMEHLYKRAGLKEEPRFSEQYLNWVVKSKVGDFSNTWGSNSYSNLEGIHEYGVVTEDLWPYETTRWSTEHDPACGGAVRQRPVRCFTNGEPPPEAVEAPKYRLPEADWISTRTRDIKAHMYNNEKALIVGGEFYYQSWNHRNSTLPTNQEYWRQGYVLYPNEADIEASRENSYGHTFLLVGWDDNLEVERVDANGDVMVDENGEAKTEKGFFIFKNSWGTDSFGINNEYGAGYGFISYDYINEFGVGRFAGLPDERHLPGYDGGESLECSTEEFVCDGQCVPQDEDNCGSCGVRCVVGEMCAEGACVAHEGQLETFGYDGEPVSIPDYDPDDGAGSVTLELEVGGSGIIQDLTVDVEVEHTYNGDIQLELIHPDGESVEIRDAEGTPGHDISIEDRAVPEFIGLDSAGIWQLRASDHARYDEGSVQSWSLRIVR